MNSKKKITPKSKPTLEKAVEAITNNVVKILTPKIDGIFDKVSKKFEVEIKEIRKTIEAIQLPTPVSDPIKANPSIAKGGLGDQLENLLGSLGSGKIPLTDIPSLDQQQSNQPQQNPMQILELIKLWKMIEGGDGAVGGISPKMMQEVNMRQQIAMTNMTNQLFQQVTRDMMKRIGATPQSITEMDLTNEHLMGKVAHIGSANKKEELKNKIRQMAEDHVRNKES